MALVISDENKSNEKDTSADPSDHNASDKISINIEWDLDWDLVKFRRNFHRMHTVECFKEATTYVTEYCNSNNIKFDDYPF